MLWVHHRSARVGFMVYTTRHSSRGRSQIGFPPCLPGKPEVHELSSTRAFLGPQQLQHRGRSPCVRKPIPGSLNPALNPTPPISQSVLRCTQEYTNEVQTENKTLNCPYAEEYSPQPLRFLLSTRNCYEALPERDARPQLAF